MRYPVSEKLEIIRLVEHSHQGVRWTLDKLGIPKTTFYRWYDRYLAIGEAGLEDRNSNPGRVWNRIPDDVRQEIIRVSPRFSPGHGLRGAVASTGDESCAPRCGTSGKQLDVPCRRHSAARRVAPRRAPALSKTEVRSTTTRFGLFLADRITWERRRP